MMMYFTVVVPDHCIIPVWPVLSNQRLLEISVALFGLLLLSEVVGAELSNSLSLAGDAASMGIDILTYLCNMYGERIRSNSRRSSSSCSCSSSKLMLDVVIPSLSAGGLLVVTLWVAFDAVQVLRNPPPSNTVDTSYLYGFATVNLGVDLICGYLFHASISVEAPVPVPQLSLDTSIEEDLDDEDEFGVLEDLEPPGRAAPLWTDDLRAATATGTMATSQRSSSSSMIAHGLRHLCGWSLLHGPCCSSSAGPPTGYYSEVDGEVSVHHHQHHHQGSSSSNLNMMSAFIHIVGDTLRTVAIFLAALVSSVTRVDGDVCDAWAALVVSLSVLLLCGSLFVSIGAAARSLVAAEQQYKNSSSSGAHSYLRVLSEEDTDDDDDDDDNNNSDNL